MGNTGTGWEEETFSMRNELFDMARQALKNYKAEQGQPNQASLHTIAYALAIQAWQGGHELDRRLERIAQALETGLKGEKITSWQVIDILHDWVMQWERERLNITLVPFDIIHLAHNRITDEWTTAIYSDTGV